MKGDTDGRHVLHTQGRIVTGPELLEPQVAAAMLGIHPRTLARWADEGRLWRTWTPGGHRRYKALEVQALAVELGVAPARKPRKAAK